MPPNRLDHSMCLLPWKVCADGNEDEEQANSPSASETVHLAFVFGGMDTQGVIYNDCIVTVVSWLLSYCNVYTSCNKMWSTTL